MIDSPLFHFKQRLRSVYGDEIHVQFGIFRHGLDYAARCPVPNCNSEVISKLAVTDASNKMRRHLLIAHDDRLTVSITDDMMSGISLSDLNPLAP